MTTSLEGQPDCTACGTPLGSKECSHVWPRGDGTVLMSQASWDKIATGYNKWMSHEAEEEDVSDATDFVETVVLAPSAFLDVIQLATARGMEMGYERAMQDHAGDGGMDAGYSVVHPFLGNDDEPDR